MPERITFVGEIHPYGGYGQHSIQIIRWLMNHGYFVSVRPIKSSAPIPIDIQRLLVRCEQPEELELVLSQPQHNPSKGKRTIYFSMCESSRIRPESVAMLNRSELVVVPSEWCHYAFKDSGVKVPIVTIPLGIDASIYKHTTPLTESKTCVFGSGGNLSNGYKRKGLDDVIAAFRMAFRDSENVVLRLKTGRDITPRNPMDDRIELNTEDLTDEKMADWYGSIHCYVSGSKAEGFGLMPLQAMACGRSVIAARYSGQAEFLTDDNSLGLRFSIKNASDAWLGCGEWCQPSISHMAQAMQFIYKNRKEAIRLGHNAANDAARMTWDLSNRLLEREIKKLCQSA